MTCPTGKEFVGGPGRSTLLISARHGRRREYLENHEGLQLTLTPDPACGILPAPSRGGVAQLVEQRTHKPRVTRSIRVTATKNLQWFRSL